MVFTAGVSHAASDRKTWFGYWRDDGYVKTKHRGRIDLYHLWPEIRDRWVAAFRNREARVGESVLQKVSDSDEWCAEAYIDTDYSKVSQNVFDRVVRNYVIFKLSEGPREETSEEAE